jgi:hypothetical protein
MSPEQLLLIVVLLMLPLIQYLLGARKQHGHEPAQAESLPPSVHRPPMPVLQPPPAAENQTRSGAITPEREPAQDAGAPAAAIRRSTRRGTAVVGLYDPRELRRAIVWMTVLEPCRAVHPHD